MSDLALSLSGVERTYKTGAGDLNVLRSVGFGVKTGEIAALVAPSGTGKSTLLHVAGLLERPNAGDVSIAGQSCNGLSDRQRTLVRRHDVGFVYQFHHLQGEFSALENVMMPQLIRGVSRKQAAARAGELLETVGLAERLDHRPARLSGGEQQRVAIVRALANAPKILLADEPTGNLDPQTSESVFEVLLKMVRDGGLSALIATHNMELARKMDRVLTLSEGQVVEA